MDGIIIGESATITYSTVTLPEGNTTFPSLETPEQRYMRFLEDWESILNRSLSASELVRLAEDPAKFSPDDE
jgi:hypothetical protein